MEKAMYRIALVGAALLLSLGMKVPGGRKAIAGPLNSPKQETRIELKDFSFQPATLNVGAGSEVTWVNRDEEPHTVVSTDKRFASKALDTGEQFSYTFTKPGAYEYFCSIHPRMVGHVIVTGAGKGPSPLH